MKRYSVILLGAAAIVLALTTCHETDLFARGGGGGGRGGGGGGGGRGGGGGGGGGRPMGGGGGAARPSGGYSGGARPGGGAPARPAYNPSPGISSPRPSAPVGGGVARPGGAPSQLPSGSLGNRGPGNMTGPAQLPNTGIGGRPNIGGPSVSNPIAGRPGVGNPGVGNPGVGRPGVGNPGVGNPGVGRPGVGNPGIGQGPGVGNRPSVLPGLGLGAAAGIGAGAIGDSLGRRQGQIADRGQNLTDRSQNLQDRLGDRQDLRDNRQDFRDDRREDWQNFRDDYYGIHNGWYHGAWCDHWGDYWSHMWSDHTAAMVLGTTFWGLNRMNYWYGTEDYVNPYYVEPAAVDATYAYYAPATIPVTVTTAEAPAAPSGLPAGVSSEGMQKLEAARASFLVGQYQQALAATNAAIKSMPNDAVAHEFRALCLFALGNYKEAAATLHPVLAVGPGWDWTTMSSLYPSPDVYTGQLRALEAAVTKTPSAADLRFLLGYHYLACGHTDNAKVMFGEVKNLAPNDMVTTQLTKMLGGPAANAPAPPKESTVKIDAAKLQGIWSASRGGKTTFELTLSPDKSFRWVYKAGKTTQEVKGAYAIDGNVLAMEPDAGGVMLAEIDDPADGNFDFKPIGTTGSDLRFRKQ